MPKIVNREDRREEVCGAAMRILARGGQNALTLRSLADELNGSITLVTHFFANRADLFEAIVDDMLNSWELDPLWTDEGDPTENLRTLLEWMVPFTEAEEEREASRLALISARAQSPSIDHFYVVMEERARNLLTAAVAPLVAESAVTGAVDALRASTNGLVVSIVEHPELWTHERRRAYLDFVVAGVAHLAPERTA